MDFGCLTCTGANQCQICKAGYYLQSNGSCILCSSKFPGCQTCNISFCHVCQSNYFQNLTSPTTDCSICSQHIPGCNLCLTSTSCLACDSGYYMNGTLQCESCTKISQCLICSDSNTCLFCAVGYYLLSDQCYSCSSAINGCFSCLSPTTCISCSSNFALSGAQCV